MDFVYLDSGVGGLPYLRHLLNAMPKASCAYVADTKNFPYGEMCPPKVIDCAKDCVTKIIERFSPTVIVVACNTISVVALDELRHSFPKVKFVGTVPALKLAASVTKTKVIGLLATNRTICEPYTENLVKEFARDCKIISRGDPELVSFIEHRYFSASDDERLLAVKDAMDYFMECGCDAVVLACTHFLNMVRYFEKYAAGRVAIIDSRDGVTRQALKVFGNAKKSELITTPRLFITSYHSADDNDEEVTYKNFCAENSIEFAGLLE